MTDINVTQKKVLKKISDGKQHEVCNFDQRTLYALDRRGLALIFMKKTGAVVKITSKGKKALN